MAGEAVFPVPVWRWGEPTAPLAACLARGGVVAFPTESSYALGADPASARGVETVYRIKGREAGKPLPVVVAGREQVLGLGIPDDLPILWRLFRVWPAALSALLPTVRPLPAAAGSGQLALRVPALPPLVALLRALGTGLTATSANRSGEEPLLTSPEVAALVAGEDAVVVDGGRLPGGLPSTLVAFGPGGEGWTVLRPGAFPAERLAELFEGGAPEGG